MEHERYHDCYSNGVVDKKMERRSNASVALTSSQLISEANRLDEDMVERRKRLQTRRRMAFARR
jgi:hypothetical protein